MTARPAFVLGLLVGAVCGGLVTGSVLGALHAAERATWRQVEDWRTRRERGRGGSASESREDRA